MPMTDYTRYTFWLVSLIAGEMLILILAGIYLDPLAGDITRLGWYAENDYGWNQPQRIFEKQAPPLKERYDRYSDVLVVGDSFSFAGNYGVLNYPWQTFFSADTGFSVTTISHYTHANPPRFDASLVPAIVNSQTFRDFPPRIFIVEVVERSLDSLSDIPGDCRPKPMRAEIPTFSFNPDLDLMPARQVFRNSAKPPLKEHLEYVKQYLANKFERQRDYYPKVYELGLTTSKLFSNKRSGQLLVLDGDVQKASWDEKKFDHIRCKLINMKNLVQENGKTFFVAMIVPDKLTAYSAYLKDPSLSKLSLINRLATDKSLHIPRIDLAVKSVIDEGMVDVYLPNDTHWSYLGFKTGARAVARYLENYSGE